MKKRAYYLFMALLGALTACQSLEIDPKLREGDGTLPKVRIAFDVALPADEAATKAMGDTPTIDNMYVAVFGGNGFFNEWVPATLTDVATTNYPSTITKYRFTADLTMSDSRLRLHFIANCPEEYRDMPPITGISAQDVEDVVIAKIQSHYSASDGFNDSYWQKVILPNGIKSSPDNAAVPGNTNVLTPSVETMAQFPDPVVLVRNFARIYLVNLTDDVTIYKYGLAYAPKDGPVAPILSAPYAADKYGHLLLDGTGKPRTFDDLGDDEEFYYESFFINYQEHPLVSDDENVIKCTDKPYYYRGYNPGEMGGVPTDAEMLDWSGDRDNNNQAPLYMYERTVPNTTQTATRVIIKAQKGSEPVKYYALDINGSDGSTIPIFRNNTYTVKLTGIAENTGETSAAQAAQQASANISKDTDHQEYNQISDGTSMISASYTDVIYVAPGTLTYDVYFRYIPNLENGEVRNDDVEFQIGYKDESDGTFTLNGTSALGPVFRSESVSIASGKEYVRENNAWVEATTSSTGERYGKISYTLVNNDDYDGIVSAAGYYTQSRVQCIRIIGKSTNISRDVIVRISPRKMMTVTCLNKYVVEAMGEPEVISIDIPNDLPRSMFPLDLKIEAAAKSLTPDNDELPVASGRTIVMDNSMNRLTGPSYHFVKTITREEYLAMVAATSANTVTVQAHFKTSVAHSESIVYVQNDYFEQNASSFDSFSNYFKRKFTINSFTAGDGEDVNFSFSLDTENAGKDIVWNNNANAASSSYRVLPNVVTIVLNGLEPKLKDDGTTYDDKLSSLGGNRYRWTVGSLSSTPTATDANITLHLEATAENYSVSLSTSLISPNPDLYEPATADKSTYLRKLDISNARFEDADGNSVTSLVALVGREVYFRFDYDSENLQPVTFNLQGLNPPDDETRVSVSGSTYTFTPVAGSGNSQRIKLVTTTASGTTRLDNLAVASTAYNTPAPRQFTLTRTTSFRVEAYTLYVRGASANTNPSNINNGTYIYVYSSTTNITSNNSYMDYFRYYNYYNYDYIDIDLTEYTNPSVDTKVYFRYGNKYRYYSSCTIGQLLEASTSSPLNLLFTTTAP